MSSDLMLVIKDHKYDKKKILFFERSKVFHEYASVYTYIGF